ncbi:hypothetical protein J7L68_05970 [bacterium]|nr:hypothetical protein [bacterium]
MQKFSKHSWLQYYMMSVGVLAFFSLIVRPGLEFGDSWNRIWVILDIIIIASFILNILLRFIWAIKKKEFIRKNSFEFAILFIFIAQFLITLLFMNRPEIRAVIHQLGIVSITKIYIVLAQIFILIEFLAQLGKINSKIATLPLPPSLLFMGSFILVILTGTILLLLPGATKSGISFINALFTATSATCVTGLIVVPTGTFFTKYGHTVILFLIQIGGLGLMTFATFSALILRGELGIKERVMLGDVLNLRVMNKIKSLLGAIIGFTFTLEFIGTIAFYFATDRYSNLQDGKLYFSIFHSVSAFCNAGFSLWDKNLLPFVNNALGSITVMLLIVLGGIGFIVLADWWAYFKEPLKLKRLARPHLSLHSKFVMTITASLIIVGALLFFILERNGQLASLSTGYKWLASFFQAITPRTAGFNTLDTNALAPATLFMLIILMFIGASPGSTGGGIKTTTFGVLGLTIFSRLKGNSNMKLFGRNIPSIIAQRAGMVLFLAIIIVSSGLFFLLIFEQGKTLLQLLFEEISAFGTVGLSTGITSSLSVGGKLIIIVTMFLGRIGPLTFLTSIIFRKRKDRIKYLDENIMIG